MDRLRESCRLASRPRRGLVSGAISWSPRKQSNLLRLLPSKTPLTYPAASREQQATRPNAPWQADYGKPRRCADGALVRLSSCGEKDLMTSKEPKEPVEG